MCRISVKYDNSKKDIIKDRLKNSGESISGITRLLYDAIASGCSIDDIEAFLIRKRVESDPEDTVYHFDNADDAIKFMKYATD